MSANSLTIREAFQQASSLFVRHGIDEAGRQAELLLQHVLGWTRTQFLLELDAVFPDAASERWENMLARRLTGEPLQYITGEQEFYGLTFAVDRAVLIPRPETELLVEAILKLGRIVDRKRLRVLDVGTGSGAIAVTLAVQCPDWSITALDISDEALTVARRNALAHGVLDCIQWIQGDLLQPWMGKQANDDVGAGGVKGNSRAGELAGQWDFDILVSNPPYIKADDIPHLQREVALYEPHSALDGGSDGLRLYAAMIEQLRDVGRLPRIVAFEVGMGQPEAVRAMLESIAQWKEISIIPDLAGIDRHVIAVR